MHRSTLAVVAMLGVLAALLLGACGSAVNSGPHHVTVVAFSVAKGPYDQLQQDFADTAEGKDASFASSYGASGDQSRNVASGAKADVVHFSLEGDMTRLVDAGLVAKDWNAGPTKGILTRSVVVFVVRKGNPKGIESWEDLVKPGIGIVSPNPGSSGSARWNVLAAYGHVLAKGGTAADAGAYLARFFEHVDALPGSGREATTAFTSGTGDVLISYEDEAIAARQGGADVDYVVPAQTILIENPAAVTVEASKAAKDFLAYAQGEAGQRVFAEKGFRPMVGGIHVTVEGANDPKDPFPTPAKLFTIEDTFGGWSQATKEFFDEDGGLVPEIQKQTGKS